MNNADFKQRFLFPETDIRGELVRLDESLEAILGTHDYPLAVQGLVGEAVAAVALLAGTLAAMLAAFPLLFPEPGADAIPSSAAPAIWQRPGDFYALAARAVTEARVIAEGDAEAPAKLRETCAACHADFLHFDPFGATKTADN